VLLAIRVQSRYDCDVSDDSRNIHGEMLAAGLR
jgi:hypothetical protein